MWREENSMLYCTEVYDYRTDPVAFVFEGDYNYIPDFKPIYLRIDDSLSEEYAEKVADKLTNAVKSTMCLRQTHYTEYAITLKSLPKLKLTIALESEFISDTGFNYMKDVLISRIITYILKSDNLSSKINLNFCSYINLLALRRLQAYQYKFKIALHAAEQELCLQVSSTYKNASIKMEQYNIFVDTSDLRNSLYSKVIDIVDIIINIFDFNHKIKSLNLIFINYNSQDSIVLRVNKTVDSKLNMYTKKKLFHLLVEHLSNVCWIAGIAFDEYQTLLREAEKINLCLTENFI